jgi:cell filamentation protein, protein adenylyltransferase
MTIPESELNFENAVDYHYDMFPPKNLDYSRLITPIAKASDAIARFDQMLKNMHNSRILLAPLRSQEAVISSRMEGTISTMDEILQYEADHDNDEDNSSVRSDVIETILYQRALTTAQASIVDGQPLSEWLIKAMHERLLSIGRGANKSPGEYKMAQNYLADKNRRDILFVPISAEKLQEGMENLFNYINSSDDHSLIKTALSHVEFEALHPFKDGNGRVGRMLITLMLWEKGVISAPHFYISGHLEDEKALYLDSLREVSKNQGWTDWCIFFLNAIEKQAIRNLEISENIKELYEAMKEIFGETLSSQWSVNALDFIFTNPVFRNNKFTQASGIPDSTAARFTRVLSEEGLLKTIEPASGRRAALYAFEPLLELVRV